MHHWTRRNRSTSWVPSGAPGPMMHFRDPWSQAPPSQALPREISSFVLSKCMVVGKFLLLYVSFTGQHNLKGFVSVSTPLISKMRTFSKKSASMVQIIMKYRIEQRRPIFDSPQNKTKNFPSGILSQIGRCW